MSGFVVGKILSLANMKEKFFLDDQYWEVPELERPYYFDKRGENTHQNEENKDNENPEKEKLIEKH